MSTVLPGSAKPKHVDGVVRPRAKMHATAIHTTAQKPKTLMRAVVKKPKLTPKNHLQSPAVGTTVTPVVTPVSISQQRLERAQKVAKSRLINRFGEVTFVQKVHKKTAILPVKAAPAEHISYHHTSPLGVSSHSFDRFQDILQGATSHTQTAPAKSKRHHRLAKKLGISAKKLTITSGTAAVLLLGSFYAFQNSAQMEFKMAASRAGVSATLPGYHPSGYSLKGPVQFSPGQITIRFASTSDDRSYAVTQTTSNWNSNALFNNVVAQYHQDYEAVQSQGRTVYVYNGANATWVDGGIWYQVQGDASMTSDQLLRIAASM